MELTKERLKELLVSPGHIAPESFESAVKNFEKRGTGTLDQFLVEESFVSDENLGKTIADNLDYHFINIQGVKITDELLYIIPEIVAKTQKAIIFKKSNDALQLATTNPDNYDFFRLLEKKTGYRVEPFYATPKAIEEALQLYKGDLDDQIKKLIKECADNQDDEDVTSLVNLFLEYAYDNRASDIHLEPLENIITVRFRIDGILHEVATYPKILHEKVVLRLKVMSHLRTDEQSAPQDGRFEYHIRKTIFDVRISIVPITDGENIVMRILSGHSHVYTIETLGFSEHDLKKIKRAASKPHGMILLVGPTGSGKTTALYTIIQFLSTPEINIMTIEDPVEYDIERVQQIQVNAAKNLTFVTGLRSIVRQDPDVIMVGEIRDNETADIAINAAMTGHLLLSTMHTNDAATTFPRLMEMGIESFLVASSVNVVVAIRLIRKICNQCRISYHITRKDISTIHSDPYLLEYFKKASGKDSLSELRLYKGEGCKACGNTGYSGRTGIFEVLEITEEVRVLITEKASAEIIDSKAKELGMTPLVYDGFVKALEGVTTLEEVIRTTRS